MSNEQETNNDEQISLLLREYQSRRAELMQPPHSQRTAECPSLRRFNDILAHDNPMTDAEGQHIRAGCFYCERTMIMVTKELEREIAGSEPILDAAEEEKAYIRHHEDGEVIFKKLEEIAVQREASKHSAADGSIVHHLVVPTKDIPFSFVTRKSYKLAAGDQADAGWPVKLQTSPSEDETSLKIELNATYGALTARLTVAAPQSPLILTLDNPKQEVLLVLEKLVSLGSLDELGLDSRSSRAEILSALDRAGLSIKRT